MFQGYQSTIYENEMICLIERKSWLSTYFIKICLCFYKNPGLYFGSFSAVTLTSEATAMIYTYIEIEVIYFEYFPWIINIYCVCTLSRNLIWTISSLFPQSLKIYKADLIILNSSVSDGSFVGRHPTQESYIEYQNIVPQDSLFLPSLYLH